MMSLDKWNGRKYRNLFSILTKTGQISWWFAQKLEEKGGLEINSFKLIIHKDKRPLKKASTLNYFLMRPALW